MANEINSEESYVLHGKTICAVTDAMRGECPPPPRMGTYNLKKPFQVEKSPSLRRSLKKA
ncbi:MAG: hypothetical protein LBB48_01795 [Treponema sp.]|nr:hypothetical protein [Treponema sp.]